VADAQDQHRACLPNKAPNHRALEEGSTEVGAPSGRFSSGAVMGHAGLGLSKGTIGLWVFHDGSGKLLNSGFDAAISASTNHSLRAEKLV
jgi:hypothetical protein